MDREGTTHDHTYRPPHGHVRYHHDHADPTVGGEAIDIVCRLSGQEEEILRSELRKVIRVERDHDCVDKGETISEPLMPGTIPSVGSHAEDR